MANEVDNVRIIPDGIIYLGDYGMTPPTSNVWTPPTDAVAIGYYSEEGYNLTPEPGENVTFEAHNGDTVYDEDGVGTWALAFGALESNKTVIEAYFDTKADPETGVLRVSSAAVSTYRSLVAVAFPKSNGVTSDEPILKFFPRVKVSAREAITYNKSTLLTYGMTFKAYRDPVVGDHIQIFDPAFLTATP